MDAKTIAWVLPHPGYDDEPTLGPLREQGFRVVTCVAGETPPADAELRVLQADLFADSRRLRREYVLDARPTLIVASTAAQEVDALGFIKPRDDVVRGLQPAELLVLRLARLLKHAGGEALLQSLEFTDELTGLANRKRWQSQLAQELGNELAQECRAVVLFDLDHFKHINDRFGHQAGDKVLREAAALLLAETAPGDKLARWGGEEFVALISRYDRQTVTADVQRMLQRLAGHAFFPPAAAAGGAPFERLINRFDDTAPAPLEADTTRRMPVTASAGLAFLRERSTFADVMNQADVALFEAKSRGRNRLVSYETLQEASGNEDRDLYVRHFENVTRVMTERMTSLVTNMGRSLVEAARREANQDALTQLHNRRYFDSRLAREFETARKHGRSLTIALVDLDHFHDVNATYGYPTGDHVLRRFSEVARNSVRLTDWLARYGGEEFCLVMPDTDLETGARVAERVRRNVAATTLQSIDQRPVTLTASVGVAQLGEQTDSPLSLVQRASEALLGAKQAGRNRLVVDAS
ncbi:GGDEF domain-containing protein [Rhizobacter sp. AJA081-3]|uniref:diguanylate cyclase n=1 Tax=Rhizobacter sp. AJA081-3 TaxID=2753607 RepID=UPI001BB579CF|nr:GGDEF domain-containing protein [Rhizobacter sp. AJA081-3]QTN23318.1 GGDEF domain-containing protein [Rhizobacter sp. AJA081-3]